MRAPLFLLVAITTALPAQRTPARVGRPIVYEISFPNAVHHEAEITVTFPNVPRRPLEVRMSRSSPGRYALHEFAKNVYSVKAVDSRGRPLDVRRPNPHQWDVHGHDGTVRITYTLFADRADGTYAGIDLTHAHLNMPATFMWARGLDERPIRITFRAPDPRWRIATQLAPTADSATFTAPGLQYFLDSPTEISAHELFPWQVADGERRQTVRVALHHAGSREDAERYVEATKRIVSEMATVYGELPRFDYGTYTFLADYLPHVNGDGMEHRNSTVVSSTAPISTSLTGLLGTVSHEFFHAWNVERIRPRTLEPFDFEEANMSGELWLAEGFTSYYGPLILRRAGIVDLPTYMRQTSGSVNGVLAAPGRRFFSAIEMSQQAPFVDAAASIDPQNKQNTFISYYTYGAALGLALDLTLRTRFRGVTLDDFMRDLWVRHGRTERPYTLGDVRAALGRVTRDTAFANDFFRRYIAGREAPDYAALLAHAGIVLRPAAPGAAWMGDQGFRFDTTGNAFIASGTLIGSPLHAAGLDRNDRVVSIDGRPIRSQADIDSVLAAHKAGDAVPLSFEGRSGPKETTLTFAESPRLESVPFEEADRPVTDEIRRFRASWLESRIGRE